MQRGNDVPIVIGSLMMVLGVLVLLSNLGVLQLTGEMSWALTLAVSAVAFAIVYARERRRWWALLLACLLGLMAWERLLPWSAYDQWGFMWELCLMGTGVAFVILFLRSQARWWWLLSGGILLTIGLTSLVGRLEVLSGSYQAVLLFAGLGFTFGALYLVRNEQRRLAWAQHPALSLLGVAVLIFVLSTPVTSGLVLPLVLLGIGVALLLRSLRRAKSDTAAKKH